MTTGVHDRGGSPVLIVGLVRLCGGDLLKVDTVQIKHPTTVVRAARDSR